MLRKRKNKLYKEPPLDEDVEEGNRKFDLTEPLKSDRFDQVIDKYLLRMSGFEMNLKLIQKIGFDKPILLVKSDGLELKMPPKSFLVRDVRNCVGPDRLIDVMDVKTQKNIQMTMKDFCKYYESKHKDKLLNVISLEFSHTKLDELVESPMIVKLLDWVDLVWPKALKESQTESTNTIQAMKYPKVQKYCLMSVKGSYTDFHIDFGGTSVWYHIIKGRKIFWMVPPTELNLQVFEHWTLSGNPQHLFLGDTVEDCFRVELEQGNTFFIPSGWIHAVYTLEDSLVFGGNFLHSFSIENQLRVSKIEDATKVPAKFRYPFYTELSWYVIQHYVHCLTGRDHLHKIELANENANAATPPKATTTTSKAKEAIKNNDTDQQDEEESNANDKKKKLLSKSKKKLIDSKDEDDSTEAEESETENEEENDEDDECEKSKQRNNSKKSSKNAKLTGISKTAAKKQNSKATSNKKGVRAGGARSSKKAQAAANSRKKAVQTKRKQPSSNSSKRQKASNSKKGKQTIKKSHDDSNTSDSDDTETDIDEDQDDDKTSEDDEDDNDQSGDSSTDIDSSVEETIKSKTANTCRMTKNSLSRLQYEIAEDKLLSDALSASAASLQQPPKKSIKLSKEDNSVRKRGNKKQQQQKQQQQLSNSDSDLDDSNTTTTTLNNSMKQAETSNITDLSTIIGTKNESQQQQQKQQQQLDSNKLDLTQMMLLNYGPDSMKLNGWSCASGGHSLWSEAAKSVETDSASKESSKEAEAKKNKIHLTRYELDGLKALMKHLSKLSGTKKNLPSLIRNSRHLLDDCRRMLNEHESDDPVLAATGKPITLEAVKELTEAAEAAANATNPQELNMNQLIAQYFKPSEEDTKPNVKLLSSSSSLLNSSPGSKLAALAAATTMKSISESSANFEAKHNNSNLMTIKSSSSGASKLINNLKGNLSLAQQSSQYNRKRTSSSTSSSSPIKMIDVIPQPVSKSAAKNNKQHQADTDSKQNNNNNTNINNNNNNISNHVREETKCLSPNKKGAAQSIISSQNNHHQQQQNAKRPESPPTRPISNNQYRARQDNELCLPNSFADLIAATSTNKPKVYDVTGLNVKELHNHQAASPAKSTSKSTSTGNNNNSLVQKPTKPSTSEISLSSASATARRSTSGSSSSASTISSSENLANSASQASSISPKQQQQPKIPYHQPTQNSVINSQPDIPQQQPLQQQQMTSAAPVVVATPAKQPTIDNDNQQATSSEVASNQQKQSVDSQQQQLQRSSTIHPIIIDPQPRPTKPKPISTNKYLNKGISSTSTTTATIASYPKNSLSSSSNAVATTAPSVGGDSNKFQERPTVIVVATKKAMQDSVGVIDSMQNQAANAATDYSMQVSRGANESQPTSINNSTTPSLPKRIILPITTLPSQQHPQLIGANPLSLSVDNVQQYHHLNPQQLQQLQAHQRHQLQLHHQLQQQQHQQMQNQLQFQQQQLQHNQHQQDQQLQMQMHLHQYEQLKRQYELQQQQLQQQSSNQDQSTSQHQPSSSASSPSVSSVSGPKSSKSRAKNAFQNQSDSMQQVNGLSSDPRSASQSPQQPLPHKSSSSKKSSSRSEKQQNRAKSQAELQQQATNARLAAAIPVIHTSMAGSTQSQSGLIAQHAYLPIGSLTSAATMTTPTSAANAAAAAAVANQNARLAAHFNNAALNFMPRMPLMPVTTSGAGLLTAAPSLGAGLSGSPPSGTRALLMHHPSSMFMQAKRLPGPAASSAATPPTTTSTPTSSSLARSPIDNTALLSLATTALSTAPSSAATTTTTPINMANAALSPFNHTTQIPTAYTTTPSQHNNHHLSPTHLHSLSQLSHLNHHQQQLAAHQQLSHLNQGLLLNHHQHPASVASVVSATPGGAPLIALRPTTGGVPSAVSSAAGGQFNLAASQAALFNPYLTRMPMPNPAGLPPTTTTTVGGLPGMATPANGTPNPGQIVYLLPPYGGYFMNQNRARSS